MKTLYSWDTAVSPHLAAALEGKPLNDEDLRKGIVEALECPLPPSCAAHIDLLETAGGVLSPGPSGSAQADIYENLHEDMCCVLVGDGRLGGISATLTALESLTIRGFDVRGVVTIEKSLEVAQASDGSLGEQRLDNSEAVQHVLSTSWSSGERGNAFQTTANNILKGGGVLALPDLPPQPEPLAQWVEDTSPALGRFLDRSLR